MDILELKGHIKSSKFNPFYIFTGEETKVMDIYIEQISSRTKLSIARFDSLSEVYQQLKAKSLIQQRFLYMIRDDKEFMQSDKLWDKYNENINGNIVIFYYTSIDKRTKFSKHFADEIIIFEPLDRTALKRHIQKECNLSDANCEKLIDACEQSYGRILLELDKLKRYEKGDNKAFEYLLDTGAIHQPPHDAIFDFVAQVMNRKPRKALDLLEESYAIGEPSIVLISVLYNNIKQLLQVQSCEKENLKIGDTTGLNGFQIRTVKPYVGKYSNGELVRFMRYLRRAEKGIKTGEIPAELAVMYALVNCM